MIQLSHPYMTMGKTIALTIQIFVSKVISLLFNTLCRFVIAFLLRSKCLLICGCNNCQKWFWSPSKQSVTVSIFFPIYLPWSGGNECHDFFECCILSQLFHFPLSNSSRGSLILFYFCHKGGVICISEIVDIAPNNLDSCLWITSPAFCMM